MTEALEATELVTRVGRAGRTDHLFFGYRHFRDLGGRESYTSLLAMAISGRPMTKEDCDTLDEIAAVTTFADPRIWPLKVARIVSSYGHLLPAWAAGLSVLESSLLGPWTMLDTAASVAEVALALGEHGQDTASAEQAAHALLERKRRLLGFGVPFRPRDERLEALRACLEKRGRTRLRHWRAGEILSAVVREQRSVEPNVGLGVAAACLDLGFAQDEVAAVGIAIAQHTVLATAMEGARQQPELLRELPPRSVRYVGKPARSTPRPGAGAQSAQDTRQPGVGRLRGRVLVVDDDPLVASAVRRSLVSTFDVLVVTQAQEALSRITSGERFDVVVCDLMMPQLSGIELFAALRAVDPLQAERMLFLSGGAYTEAAQRFLASVANPFLAKPFDPAEMLAAVEKLLRLGPLGGEAR